MKITVELSYYPFREDFRASISDFVKQLDGSDGLSVTIGATSSVITGEFDTVMARLTELLKWSYDTHGKAVYVAKILPGYDVQERVAGGNGWD